MAGKDKQNTAAANTPRKTWQDVDEGIAPFGGKRVYYQLTDAEGGTKEADGRKSPAIIVKRLRGVRHPETGQLVDRLLVFPCTGGAPFSVNAPQDSSRQTGTWDSLQNEDFGNN